ncbi:MAG: RsmG family class I SAM-dependent methyltransferase [Acidimicrobiales bacterium]
MSPDVPGTSRSQAWPELTDQDASNLVRLLTQARDRGFLGPGDVGDQITRSLAFAVPAGGPVPTGLVADLGSGGGLPALILALVWPDTSWLLIDSNQRRTTWLREASSELGIAPRVEVVCERAEVVARGPYRHRAQLVTARSFGPPSATAECAAPLLAVGGGLLVADPPEGPEPAARRWPAEGLSLLGLELGKHEVIATAVGPVSFSKILAVSECAERFPRRVGAPFKRPLF